MPKRWVTALGATLAILGGILGLALKFMDAEFAYIMITMGIMAFGLGRKLDRLRNRYL